MAFLTFYLLMILHFLNGGVHDGNQQVQHDDCHQYLVDGKQYTGHNAVEAVRLDTVRLARAQSRPKQSQHRVQKCHSVHFGRLGGVTGAVGDSRCAVAIWCPQTRQLQLGRGQDEDHPHREGDGRGHIDEEERHDVRQDPADIQDNWTHFVVELKPVDQPENGQD